MATEGAFQSLGKTPAIGNSEHDQLYKLEDWEVQGNEFIYYRLYQADFDGKLTYFNVIFVDTNNKQHIDYFTVYPNPSNGTIHIKPNIKLANVKITMMDITGKIRYQNVLNNTSLEDMEIFATEMNSGVYLLIMEGVGFRQIEKIIKY